MRVAEKKVLSINKQNYAMKSANNKQLGCHDNLEQINLSSNLN